MYDYCGPPQQDRLQHPVLMRSHKWTKQMNFIRNGWSMNKPIVTIFEGDLKEANREYKARTDESRRLLKQGVDQEELKA